MSHQFNRIFLLVVLLLAGPKVLCQSGSDSLINRKLDSMMLKIENRYDARIDQLQGQFHFEIYQKQRRIDSLRQVLEHQGKKIHQLQVKDSDLASQLEDSDLEIRRNAQTIDKEKNRLRRLFTITGPSILFLILASVILYFLLMMKQQEQTERKINALKKYTHNELEETRTDLRKKFKKRIKKLGESLSSRSDKSGKSKRKKKAKGKQGKK